MGRDGVMTPTELAEKAAAISGSIEERRWALAELAQSARAVPNYDAIIGAKARRSPRTVREWALVAEFRRSLPRHYDVPFSFYAAVVRKADKLSADDIVNALETAEAGGDTLEAFRAMLTDATREDGDDVAAKLEGIIARLDRYKQAPDIPDAARLCMEAAAEALVQAVDALEGVLA